MDDELGETYWDTRLASNCNMEKYNILYHGLSNITMPKTSTSYLEAVITVHDSSILFSLRITKATQICGSVAYQTEHPKLLIVTDTGSGFYLNLLKKKTTNLDMFTYMNSKFVYLEREVETNMNNLYTTIMTQQCLTKRQTLLLQLTIAKMDPVEFAYIYTGEAGYSATRLGEILYVVKCQTVPVTIRATQRCYHELPISYNNRSMFISPKTRLIQ